MATPITAESEWLAANPPAAERLTETLAGVSARVRSGEEFGFAIREFLDEFALRGDDSARAEAITEAPP
jgi:hypothetical protein